MVSLSIILYVIRFRSSLFYADAEASIHYESIPCLVWSVFIVLLILGEPNSLTCWFSTNVFLISSGKYSFGIYLCHLPFLFGLLTFPFSPEIVFIALVSSYFLGYLFYCIVETFSVMLLDYVSKKTAISVRYTPKII